MFVPECVLPTPAEAKEELPLSPPLAKIKAERDGLAREVLAGKSEKLLIVVGPCSAHESASVLEYARRLGRLHERVKEKLVLIPRVYTTKPRSKGEGYMGIYSQPDPRCGEDLARGIRAMRELHIRVLAESGLSSADEMLYPENYAYVDDVVTYSAVGARSSENQLHRLVASGTGLPVGIKNPMSGSIPALLNSVYAARRPQVFQYRGMQVRTEGNPYAHAVLRGRVDPCGKDIPNYHPETVEQLLEGFHSMGLGTPALLIDANHSNSGKRAGEQPRIVAEVLKDRARGGYGGILKGFMIESFLEEGSDPLCPAFGQSITDPCLGWEDTERLILGIAEKV